MLKVKTFSNKIIDYFCDDCFVNGKCLVKPQDKNATIVLDLECPSCGQSTRLKLEQSKDSNDCTWAVIIDNDLED